MDNPKIEATAKEVKPTTTAKAVPQESVYSAEELAANFRAFKTSREIVIVALRKAGKETYTLAEAKTIVENFRNKEV